MASELFDLNLLGRGKAVADVTTWVGEAIRDCLDQNKDREAVRKVTLELKIQASADGENAVVNYRVVTKFPPDSAGQDMVSISRSTKQAYINTDEQLALGGFDPVTGEVAEIRGKK